VVVDMALELYNGSLQVEEITNRWYDEYRTKNFGAMITFVGVVRNEDNISGLSFDVYLPLLQNWFDEWQKKADKQNALLAMAHSIGDVKNHESSYIACVMSPKRRVALEMIDEFVEDFKANAPIWKYDLIDGKRVYALERSHKINGSGILL
jgi:molybdopterin synthase catalytic subunit